MARLRITLGPTALDRRSGLASPQSEEGRRRANPALRLLHAGTFIVLISVLALGDVNAQNFRDGSIYSRFGVGARESFHSAKSLAMGGGGVALRSFDYANHLNPASLSDQIYTRLAGGFTLEDISATANNAATSRLSSGFLSAVQISFPIVSGQIGFGASFSPYSRVGYRIDSAASVVVDPESGTEESYTTSFRGNGGLQRLSGAMGVQVVTGLSLGVRTDFLFGIVEQSQATDFSNDALRDGDVITGTRMSGVTATLGARYVLRETLRENDVLSLGVVYTLPVSLSGEQVQTTGRGENADTLGQVATGNVRLPMSIAAGLSYQPNPRWTFIADFDLEKWSGFASDLPLAGLAPGSSGVFDDRVRISAGMEFFPGAGQTIPSFFERFKFRIGAYSDRAYYSPSPDQPIRTVGVTGGLSIPSQSVGTSLDINIEVGRRGTTEFGLINDRFVRFGVNLNFGERWFDRARLL